MMKEKDHKKKPFWTKLTHFAFYADLNTPISVDGEFFNLKILNDYTEYITTSDSEESYLVYDKFIYVESLVSVQQTDIKIVN